MIELDPRWHWIEVHDFGQRDPVYIRGACAHFELISVKSVVTGQELARLCENCDAKFPPAREPEW